MKIYIIQNIEGMTEEEVDESREEIYNYFQERNASIIDNYYPNLPSNVSNLYLYIEGWIRENMARADLCVYLGKNWKDSQRAVDEDLLASRYEIPKFMRFAKS